MSNQLYYHKCNDCLTPFSSTERHIDLCDCMGSVTFMGLVQGDKYVQTAQRPACDGRCTHAHGPSCDCACMGANHGTGRVVTTVIREGKVCVVDPSKDIYDDMVRGYKFREARDYAEKQYETLYGSVKSDMNKGIWVDRQLFVAAAKTRRDLDKILSLRVYDRRQKGLLEFIVKHKALIDAKGTSNEKV